MSIYGTAMNPMRFEEMGRVNGYTIIMMEFKDYRGELTHALFRMRSIYDETVNAALHRLIPLEPFKRPEVEWTTA